ncbi:MAG: bifunctional riboflavin kinase/FAD synthetase [Gemmatimonadales bacterium]
MTAPGESVVTVGTFDGVHLGHQALVREACRRAARRRAAAVTVTFEPHPAAVLGRRPDPDGPLRLTTRTERTEALAELGLDRLFVLQFDESLAAMSAEAFVERVLIERCGMRELVMGPDAAFGRGRRGDASTLTVLGARLGFEVAVVEPVRDESGEAISSSRIREAVAAGGLERAAEWLGRPYRLSGTVVRGAGRGRQLGIHTINLAGPPPEKALPPDGVYAARIEWGGGVAGAMLNQGPRPTVGDGRRSIEAHLFGFEGELYGRTVRIEWVARLREIRRFDSLDELREQLTRDREQALAVLSRRPVTSTARPIGAR